MSWFNEQASNDLPVDSRSFVIATANLLQRFNYDLPPHVVRNLMLNDDPAIDYWSLPRSFKGFQMDEFSEGNSWPPTNCAIVKQSRMDEAQAGIVDHYSLVADQRAHSIIDSYDGTIKSADVYGGVLSWASFTYKGDDELQTMVAPKDDNIHILEPDENLWDIGRQYNVPVAALMAENDIEDPRHVPSGTELYIPERLHKETAKDITYDILTPARKMHVNRPSGAKKWSFGGVSKWEDLFSTGRLYPDGSNITIAAVAHVPIGDDTAAYYMDAVSLGDYSATGRPRYTTGFNWQHLAEGFTENGTPDVPEATIEQVVKDAMAEEDRPELIPEPVEEEIIIRKGPISYKDSFTYLNDEHRAEVYDFKEAMEVVELDGRLQPKHVDKYDGVRIVGTFTKDGITYGRVALSGYWYAVPMDKLVLEDSLYNIEVDLPTRVAMRGHLSSSEKRLVVLAKTVSKYQQLVGLIKNKQGERK